MNKKELKNKVGQYVETGLKLISVGNRYAYYYSIWDNGKGENSGYCRKDYTEKYSTYEFVRPSRIKGK